MVFDVNKDFVYPPYLELALNDDAILNRFKKASNGSTGRKRLSLMIFLSAKIPVPSLPEQRRLVYDIVKMREEIETLTARIEDQKKNLSNILYKV